MLDSQKHHHQSDSIENSVSRVWPKVTLLTMAFYGTFTSAWYLISFGLYFLVFGDNNPNFGLYGILPAAVFALLINVWLKRCMAYGKAHYLLIVVLLTSPAAIWFTFKLLRHGV